MRFVVVPALLAASGLLFASGCTFSRTIDAWGNGAERVLYFRGIEGADVGTVPIAATRTFVVTREPEGSVDCTLGSKSAAPAPGQLGTMGGGGKPDIPEHCSTLAPENVELVAAACADDACKVTSEASSSGITLHVTATKATAVATRLSVTLKRAGTDVSWSDSVAIAFAPADRIALRSNPGTAIALHSVMLPGVSFALPTAFVADAAGKEMSMDERPTFSIVGTAIALEAGTGFLFARTPGKATLVWDAPGVIHRELVVEVAAPATVTGLELFAPTAKLGYDFSSVDIDSAPMPALAPAAKIAIAPNRQATFLARARLGDGRIALFELDAPTISPASLVQSSTMGVYTGGVTLFAGNETGEGSVMLSGAERSLTVPLTVQ